MEFSMQVADVKALQEEILSEVKPVSEEVSQLKQQAQQNAVAIMNCDLDALDDKRTIVQSIEAFGMGTMQQSSQKNALLKVTVGALSQSGSEGGQVSKSLVDLQHELKDLDPSLIDFAQNGLLGKLFNPIKSYFAKYEKSEDVIATIVTSLDNGKTVLKNDNTTLGIEEQSLRELTKKLNKEIEMGTMLDECLVEQIEAAKASGVDPERINFVENEILFPIRQRLLDMQQLVTVNHQGIIAMEVIQRNNKELIRGVDRAKNVTVSALRTAVMVASALYDQKIVLKKIQALNETTDGLISFTSKMLKEQGAAVQKQAMESGISVKTLKTSFEDVLSALDAINTYKQEALPKMKETLSQFRALADQGETRIKQLEKGNSITQA